jgi:hypothetical protein
MSTKNSGRRIAVVKHNRRCDILDRPLIVVTKRCDDGFNDPVSVNFARLRVSAKQRVFARRRKVGRP